MKKSKGEEVKIEEANISEEKPIKEIKDVSLTSRMEQIDEKLDILTNKSNFKNKPYKMKWSMRRKLKTLHKKNKVLVNLLRTNRTAKFATAEIRDGVIQINDKFHECTTDFIYLLDGKHPMIVLPEWSLRPIGTKDYYDAIKNNEIGVDAQTVIIKMIEKAQQENKKTFDGKVWIWIGIGVLILAYVLFGGGI